MKKVLKVLLLVILGLLFLGTFYWIWIKTQPKTIEYEIVEVGMGNIENFSVATGKVSPRDEVLIKPQISGIISEVLKKAGDFVKEGEIIATVKVIPEMATLNTAESRVRVAEINLGQVKTVYNRQLQLFAKGVISKEEMDNSDADFKKAKEEFENSRDNLDIVKNGISKKTAQFSNTQIRATITGMVLDIPVKVGNSVIQSNTFNDGTTIAIIANMNDMIFVGKLDETEVDRVHEGMPIKLSIGAVANQKFDATLEYISPKGIEENGAILFEIKAAARIPDTIVVRAGYSANAEITLDKAYNVLIVPESCVSFSNDSAFVYVYNSRNKVKTSIEKKDSFSFFGNGAKQSFTKKLVSTGLSDGINIEIKSGLKKGDLLKGNEVIKDPTAIKKEENPK